AAVSAPVSASVFAPAPESVSASVPAPVPASDAGSGSLGSWPAGPPTWDDGPPLPSADESPSAYGERAPPSFFSICGGPPAASPGQPATGTISKAMAASQTIHRFTDASPELSVVAGCLPRGRRFPHMI